MLAAVFKLYFRVEVVGRSNFPKHGGVVVSASHRSNLDTPIICVITQRRLRYMGKESLWKSTFGGWFLTSLGGFPVTRGRADREALRAAMTVAERGEPLVMFPEGTRQTGPKIEDENMHDGPGVRRVPRRCADPAGGDGRYRRSDAEGLEVRQAGEGRDRASASRSIRRRTNRALGCLGVSCAR